jgi:hypothetical protein
MREDARILIPERLVVANVSAGSVIYRVDHREVLLPATGPYEYREDRFLLFEKLCDGGERVKLVREEKKQLLFIMPKALDILCRAGVFEELRARSLWDEGSAFFFKGGVAF